MGKIRPELDIATTVADIVTTYLTQFGGTVQTGLDIGLELPKKVSKATTPVIYNVTLTLADTEYSQALSANVKKFSVHLRDFTAFRFAYVTGKVAGPTAPYLTIPEGSEKTEELIEPASLTLYFASAVAGKIAEIEEWV